jgi:hypothetical protein
MHLPVFCFSPEPKKTGLLFFAENSCKRFQNAPGDSLKVSFSYGLKECGSKKGL